MEEISVLNNLPVIYDWWREEGKDNKGKKVIFWVGKVDNSKFYAQGSQVSLIASFFIADSKGKYVSFTDLSTLECIEIGKPNKEYIKFLKELKKTSPEKAEMLDKIYTWED